jgi:hypothetical protein
MKRLITILAMVAFTMPAFCQVVTDKAPAKHIGVELMPDSSVYYRQKGGIVINLNNYMVTPRGVVSMPITLGMEATAIKNLTMGVLVSYEQMKNTTQISDNVTQINDAGINYHILTVGVKASYHLMPLLQKMVKKPLLTDYVDVYVSGWGGYSVALASGHNASIDFMNRNTAFRGGAVLGVRSMVLPRFGFMVEGGYGSFGILSFGITVRAR